MTLLRSLIPLSLFAVLGVALVACADDPAPAAGTTPGDQVRPAQDTVVVALTREPSNLNPVFLDIDAGNWHTFSGLLRFDRDLDLEPDLAAEMPEVSDDGRTVTVRLRNDVRFHDGQPLTADDVVFTWEAILDPDVATPLRDRFALQGLIEDVRALDTHLVEFRLSRLDPAFLERLYVGIVPKHLLEGEDLNNAEFNRNPVGTGPYRFGEWRPGDRMIFEAYEGYHHGPPQIQRVVFTFVPDDNARMALLRNGDIDFTRLAPAQAATLRDSEAHQVIEVPTAGVYQVTLPAGNAALADPAVRRALGLAIDREQMVETILHGMGAPAYGQFVRGHWAHHPGVQVAYDPDEARRQLEAAGWREGPDGFLERDGQRLAFTVMYLATISEDREFALALRSDLARIGVDVEVEGVQSPGYQDRLGTDAFLHGVGGPYDPEYLLRARFHSQFADQPSVNPAALRNPAVDEALDAARATLDREERRAAYQRLQEAVMEEGSYLYLAERPVVVVASARLGGLEPQLMGSPHGFIRGLSWNLERWSWIE